MRIYQLLPTVDSGDAVGNNTLLLDRMLRNAGFETRIYAQNIGKGLSVKDNVFPYDDFPALSRDDILIYHMSVQTTIHADIPSMVCKKIAIYHNSTPGHFFALFDPAMAHRQHVGSGEMRALNKSFDRCIAVSEFNRQDLIKMGYDADTISVIPLLIGFDDYKKNPCPETIKKYKDGYTNILFVGRLAPNKKPEDVVRVFAYYKRHVNPDSRLILIGNPFSVKYLQIIQDYVHHLNLPDVVIPGHIPFSEILAFYSVADAFVCMSEHEGFCVPLLEAMMFDVPIIAYNSCAVPETLGGSGILVDEKDPVLISKLIDKVVTDEALRREVIESQQRRLSDFNHEQIFRQIIEIVNYAEKNQKAPAS